MKAAVKQKIVMSATDQSTGKSTPSRPSRRWRRWLAGIAAVLLLLWGFLAGIAPGIVQSQAAKWASGIGRKLTLGEVSINPWRMAVEIRQLKLAEGKGSPLFAADRVYVNLDPSALLLGRWQLSEFSVDAPQLWVQRDAQGHWNWARFISDASGPAQPKKDDGSPTKFLLQALNIRNGQVMFQDQLAGSDSFKVSPLNLALTDLSTLPEAGGYRLHAALGDGTQLDWKGSLQLQPLQSSGEASIRGFTLASIWEYVKPHFNIARPQGTLSVQASYQFDLKGKQPQLQISPFSAELKGLQMQAPGTQHRFVLPLLQLKGGRFDLQHSQLSLQQIALDGGSLEAQRMADGSLDWLAALPASPAAGATSTASSKAAPAPWQVKVEDIKLANWQYRFGDAGFATPLQVAARLPLLHARFELDPKRGFAVDKLAGELADITLGNAAQPAQIALAKLSVQPSRIVQQGRLIEPGSVDVQGLRVALERNKQGQLNLAQLFARRKPGTPASQAATAASEQDKTGWTLHYPVLTLADGEVSWSDYTLSRPVSASLRALNARVETSTPQQLAVTLDGKLENGQLQAALQLDPSTAALKGQIKADALPLAPFAPYGLSTTPLRLRGGLLSAALDVESASKGWKVAGSAGISSLAIMEPGEKLPLLGWSNLKVNGIKAQSTATLPLSVAVQDVRLEALSARLILDAKRQLNWQRIFAARSAATPPSAKPVTPAKASAMPPVDIRSIHLNRSKVQFADQSMNPNFATQMHHLRGSIQGLSTRPGRTGTITLDGDVDQYGDVRVRGALAPMAVTDNTDVTLSFRNIPLNNLNPYATTFAGWRINDGRLTVDLHYLLDHRQMKGQNRVVINTIQLGEEVPDYKGTHLPLRLAVALLEDSDGKIDLDLPVSGSLDDPQFSYGQLVWKALVNVVSKVVTAPFRALGALLGGEGFDNVFFIPGEANVAPPEREKLEKVAGLMSKRPKMQLQLAGSYDPDVDSKELARARVDSAILQAGGRSLLPGEPLPVPDMADPAMLDAIKTVYARELGRLKLMSRTLNPGGPSGAALAKQLRTELIAAQKVDDAALHLLARQRAENARKVMMRNDNTLADRITLGDPAKTRAERDGVALGIKLSSK
ncbi:putative exported protein [Aquitalea magnusonii]|uniref:Putative exported protein n=2 Tax=Aquitalea magnusonii TaxID=332411 RepID=A0A3G9GGA0_9NEIS|nr:putative exported protein [Aquitalea magnusonii]